MSFVVVFISIISAGFMDTIFLLLNDDFCSNLDLLWDLVFGHFKTPPRVNLKALAPPPLKIPRMVYTP